MWCTVDAGARAQYGTRRYWRPCWQDDEACESPADVDDAASLSPCTWRSTSRCSSAAGGAYTSSSSSADPVEDCSRSSPASSLVDDGRFAALPRHHQRGRSAVDRAYSPAERSATAADGRSWPPTQKCSELSPSDNLLDFLQQQDRAPGTYDCASPASSCFEGRVGSLRRRRRSAVTPELMQMDRERAAASPTIPYVTPVLPHQRTATPDPPPRNSRRRLLPQPDRTVDSGLVAAARNEDMELRRSVSAVSSRYFMPISSQQDQCESNVPSSRRLPLVVDTSVGGTSASSSATTVVTAEPRDRRILEAMAATSIHENKMNNTASSSHVESCHDKTEVLPSATTTAPPRGQHRQQCMNSTITESVHFNDSDDDDDKLFDLPEDERGHQPARLTFRSSTLPRRWKWHHPNGESQKLVDRQDCRELWTVQAGAREDVQRATEPQSSMSSSSDPTPAKPQAMSTSALARVEAMKDRFRRLSEMYKNSLEEDSAIMSMKTGKLQNNDIGKNVENQQSTGDTDRTGTEAASKATSACKTATSVTSDTESLSSCGRDEGFESETATSSVLYGADASCSESRHSHHLTADVAASTAATATEDTATTCSEANLFACSIDSIIQQMCPRTFEIAAAEASSTSSLGTPSTDEAVRCDGLPANDVIASSTSASNRQSRLSHQRAFAERMSAPRRSLTRSPQRRTSASPSDATLKSGMYSSPAVHRKRTPATNRFLPSPRDCTPSTGSVEQRRRSDAGDVNEGDTSSSFVRGNVTRTSLPHTGISVRASSSARPTNSKDQKQSLPLTSSRTSSSSRQSYRSASRTREDQTIKAASGRCQMPVVAHVDRNGVQTKPSSATRVFSTPVRFGATSHQTRPASEKQNAGGVDGSSVPSKQTASAVSTDAHSHRGRNQQTAENASEVTLDRHSAPRINERKSVFERLFEKAHRQRHSKPEANGVATAVAPTRSSQHQAAESLKKLSSKRSNVFSKISPRQSVNNDS